MAKSWLLPSGLLPDMWARPLWFDEFNGPARTLVQTTLQNFAFYAEQTSPADGQEFTTGAFCRSAGYTLSFVYVKKADAGKVDTYINNTLVRSGDDLYAAATTYQQLITFAVTFPAAGWNSIKLKMNGKNPSSSNYKLPLTGIGFLPQTPGQFASVLLPESALPKRASLFFEDFRQISGAGHVVTTQNSQALNEYAADAAGANGDAWEASILIQAGTYSFEALGFTGPNCGIGDWALDGTNFLTTQDWYTAGNVFNVKKTGSLIIPTAGKHKLRLTVNGKNAGSSDFFIPETKIALYQAAD